MPPAFSAITSKCRNAVRKGIKNGYEVRDEPDTDFVADIASGDFEKLLEKEGAAAG